MRNNVSPAMLCCMTSGTMIPGFATPEATHSYSERFSELQQLGHFREPLRLPGVKKLSFPSLGLGTYLGETDTAADQLYSQAIVAAVRHGINLLDTAINYRHQRSERNICNALRTLAAEGEFRREEIIICSKAGYLSFDGHVPADPRQYFTKEYFETGIIKPSDIAGGMHCMAPAFISDQIDRSRRNLGLDTIDIYYLHNPESQFGDISPSEFQTRLRNAFHTMEKAVAAGKIRWYGIASWNAFRVPEDEKGHISLAECVAAAHHAGGTDHHFRFIQLPFNLAMAEAYAAPTQVSKHELVSALEFASREGIAVIGSATLHQGQLTRNLPTHLLAALDATTDAECAIQFSRSAPGMLSALVGMGRPAHVIENARLMLRAPVPKHQWEALFRRDA